VQKWEFGQMLDQRWYWRRVNDDVASLESSCTFNARMECVADAFEHGYCETSIEQSICLPRDLPPSLRSGSTG
jgi:hypothetical protein